MNFLKRKTAIVTGSTRGIGFAIALRLACEKYNVVINYARDDEQAQNALKRCQQEGHFPLLVKADISQKAEVYHLMSECIRAFQTIDVLVNNAACVIDRPLQELTEDDWDRVIDTNLKGTFLCSQAAASYMVAQEFGGTILNIGASTGIRGRKNGANTCDIESRNYDADPMSRVRTRSQNSGEYYCSRTHTYRRNNYTVSFG